MPATGGNEQLYRLVGAFALVAVVFLGAAVVAQRSAAQIDMEVEDLQHNSLPSVTHLARARTEMGHVVPEIEAFADGPVESRPATLGRLRRIRGALAAEITAAAETPMYPGEREAFDGKLQPSLARFDEDLARLVALDPAGDAHARLSAEERLIVDTDATEEALGELVEINHAPAYVAMSRILETREHTVQLALALEIGSSLVAIVAAWFAVRASRRFGEVLRRNAELQAARAAEFESFAQRVAHDLLSPMSGVVFSLGALERAHPDAATKEITQRTLRSLGRARQMVNGIFHFARSGARPPPGARAALRAGVLAAVEELHSADVPSPPAVEVEPFEECDVACDEAVLGVMLSNLLSNAEKFTRDSPVHRIVVRVRTVGAMVRVEVEDTGPGLPPGLEHSIFEPYVRAPGVTQPGLGLGLATVKRLADAHHGAVGVRRLDGGTVFWFELPRA
jgi:signal transduction histidine kinase